KGERRRAEKGKERRRGEASRDGSHKRLRGMILRNHPSRSTAGHATVGPLVAGLSPVPLGAEKVPEKKRGSGALFQGVRTTLRGRPRGLASRQSPLCSAVCRCQTSWPNCRPRCTLRRSASNSADVSIPLTYSSQPSGSSIGQACSSGVDEFFTH